MRCIENVQDCLRSRTILRSGDFMRALKAMNEKGLGDLSEEVDEQ